MFENTRALGILTISISSRDISTSSEEDRCPISMRLPIHLLPVPLFLASLLLLIQLPILTPQKRENISN